LGGEGIDPWPTGGSDLCPVKGGVDDHEGEWTFIGESEEAVPYPTVKRKRLLLHRVPLPRAAFEDPAKAGLGREIEEDHEIRSHPLGGELYEGRDHAKIETPPIPLERDR
jgi:hypothetical protein